MTVFRKIPRAVRVLLVAVFWIGVWAFAAWRVGLPLLLPSPLLVAKTLGGMLGTGIFWQTVGRSLLNVSVGILAAVVSGVLLAGICRRVRFLRELFFPLMTVVKATPVASFIVLALIWVGAVRVPALITVLIVLPVVWTNVDEGLSKIDPQLTEVAVVYRMSYGKRLRLLVFPSVRPYFLAACRTSLGLAWKAGIAAEIIARPRMSIGTAINDARQYLLTEEMFAWTFVVILLSLVIELGFTALFDRLGERKEAAHDPA